MQKDNMKRAQDTRDRSTCMLKGFHVIIAVAGAEAAAKRASAIDIDANDFFSPCEAAVPRLLEACMYEHRYPGLRQLGPLHCLTPGDVFCLSEGP